MTRKRKLYRPRHLDEETKRAATHIAPPAPTQPEVTLSPGQIPQNPETLRSLQQQVGNQAVRELIPGKALAGTGYGGAAEDVLQQVEEEKQSSMPGSATPAVEIDPTQLGLAEELPGHGNNGGVQEQGAAPSAGDGDRSPASVNAVVGLTVNPPSEETKPAVDIAAAHNKSGVAGWTTPAYGIKVPHVNSNRIDVAVTLDFKVELAEEYKGDTLKVLRDHEYGHVDIGKAEGQAHLVEGLHDDLAALPNFSSTPPIQQAIVKAAGQFSTAEGNASQAYDAMDYPRLEQAYLGARTPLTNLEADSAKIATMAGALRIFNTSLPQADEDNLEGLAQAVIDAHDALEETDLARLQYNPEFKQLVTEAETKIEIFIESYHWDLWLIKFSTLDEPARNKLTELKEVLRNFTWQPPI